MTTKLRYNRIDKDFVEGFFTFEGKEYSVGSIRTFRAGVKKKPLGYYVETTKGTFFMQSVWGYSYFSKSQREFLKENGLHPNTEFHVYQNARSAFQAGKEMFNKKAIEMLKNLSDLKVTNLKKGTVLLALHRTFAPMNFVLTEDIQIREGSVTSSEAKFMDYIVLNPEDEEYYGRWRQKRKVTPSKTNYSEKLEFFFEHGIIRIKGQKRDYVWILAKVDSKGVYEVSAKGYGSQM